ncbi:MAG: PQQ-binding-like beta-propeller repeat protein [Verrucomicrobiota bacterium]|jgi:outer membrane protein assembly factor BamB
MMDWTMWVRGAAWVLGSVQGVAVLMGVARAEWPQFRGRDASGVDDAVALPTRWDVAKGEGVRWQAMIPGLGHASPVEHAGRVYVATAVKPGRAGLKVGLYGDIDSVEEKESHQWRLMALELETGRVVWDALALEAVPRVKRHTKASHCNSTPAVDGERVVALMGSEGLFCFDLSGRLMWRKDLGPMDSGYFDAPSAQWGFGGSPILRDGRVVVQCDVQKGSFLAVYDARDGRELWRTARGDVPTWGTPAVVAWEGQRQVVVNGWKHAGGYAWEDGRELWRLDGGGDIPVPTPLFAHGLIYLTSAHGKWRPMRAIRPGARGTITPADPGTTNASIAWAHGRLGNYMQTPIVVGDLVYGCVDFGVLTAFDARAGTVRYSERLTKSGEGFTASPVSDGRHLYFPSETGKVYVVPTGPGFKVAATNDLAETCMASPAIARGMLLFRTRDKLVAIGDPR